MVRSARGPRPKKPAASRNKTAKTRTIEPACGRVTSEERYRQIAEAAYFKAEHRGFAGCDAEKDWYEAEAEIDAALSRGAGRAQS